MERAGRRSGSVRKRKRVTPARRAARRRAMRRGLLSTKKKQRRSARRIVRSRWAVLRPGLAKPGEAPQERGRKEERKGGKGEEAKGAAQRACVENKGGRGTASENAPGRGRRDAREGAPRGEGIEARARGRRGGRRRGRGGVTRGGTDGGRSKSEDRLPSPLCATRLVGRRCWLRREGSKNLPRPLALSFPRQVRQRWR